MIRNFVRDYSVRFGEIDHAGVMYYPALFDRIHRSFEDFWPEALGKSYSDVLDGDKLGFPLVHVDTSFRRPFRFGDLLRVEIAVLKIGARSVRFRFRLHGEEGGKPRAEAKLVLAVIDLNSFEARDLPDEYRSVLENYQVDEEAP